MKVLVTGATGYVGSAISEALRLAGHRVIGLARSPDKQAALEAAGHEALLGDLTDLELLRAAAAAADGVIHAALAHSPDAGAIDRAAVESMLAALAGSGKPFIYTSGVWVYGDTQGRTAGEVSMLHPPALVAWRPAVEELVLESKPQGVQGVVLRPGMVYGRRGGFVAAMFGDARQHGAVKVVGDGLNHWSSIHADDLADLYVRALNEPAAGELFVACCGLPQPVRKIALAVTRACGIEGKIDFIPLDQARAHLGPMADCLVLDQRVGSTKATRYFGWSPRRPSIFFEIFSGSYLSA
ncbi:MAG: NAD-dependent epimerase/dehydratase family protein [Bryobacteraceae bacterium]|jgi:nucleoside-diphosphate-sugar epimerase